MVILHIGLIKVKISLVNQEKSYQVNPVKTFDIL